jgi:hypothetical protein
MGEQRGSAVVVFFISVAHENKKGAVGKRREWWHQRGDKEGGARVSRAHRKGLKGGGRVAWLRLLRKTRATLLS